MGYGGHQLRLKCAQVRHHSPAGTFTRVPGRCLRWSPTPPGTPVIPCFKDIIWYNIMMSRPRYTHPAFGRVVSWQVGWKWGWKGGWGWDERENEMKDYLTRTRGRERKSRGKFGKSKHQHQHTWPGAGKPWKGKEKEKRRPTDTEQDHRRGERRKRLNQPNTAKPTPT